MEEKVKVVERISGSVKGLNAAMPNAHRLLDSAGLRVSGLWGKRLRARFLELAKETATA